MIGMRSGTECDIFVDQLATGPCRKFGVSQPQVWLQLCKNVRIIACSLTVMENEELKNQAFKDDNKYGYIRVTTLEVIQALYLPLVVRVWPEADPILHHPQTNLRPYRFCTMRR